MSCLSDQPLVKHVRGMADRNKIRPQLELAVAAASLAPDARVFT